MLDKSNSQYESFLFWRAPIPALDLSELEDIGFLDSKPTNSIQEKTKASTANKKGKKDEENELSEYSSFNYWRAPIASIDSLLGDLSLLL